METEAHVVPVAVIGISCYYPGARNLLQFWENILARRRQFREIPNCRLSLLDYYHDDPSEPDKTYGKKAALIDGFEFDWASRRVPFSTYKTTDVAHWLALETALAAVVDAGYSPENMPGERTGVIVGNSLTGEQTRSNTMRLRWPFVRRAFRAASRETHLPVAQKSEIEAKFEDLYKSAFPEVNEDSLAGGLSNTIAGRICNYLNLFGGGYTIDGACSSSLLAIATGATGLSNQDLDLVIAGGVDISLDPFELVGFSKTGALTAKDMTVYDRRGSGFIPGEGCGFVILKRLEDAKRDENYVYAVLRGWGISSDGKGASITAPSAKGQARALKKAYARGKTDISTLTMLEGHGTGTTVGDRIELEGIALAMEKDGLESGNSLRACAVTSLKSIVGHCKAAAGVGGFIKALLAVNRRCIPPTAGCRDPHPAFDSPAWRLYPAMMGEVLDDRDTLRAGVSAMGFGGINCHAVLESADSPCRRLSPSIDEKKLLASHQNSEVFLISADSSKSLKKKLEKLKETCRGISMAEITDLAFKLAKETDKNTRARCAVVVRSLEDCVELMEKAIEMASDKETWKTEYSHDPSQRVWIGFPKNRKKVGILFPGQGSQIINMARLVSERFSWAEKIISRADSASRGEGAEAVSRIMFRPTHRASGREMIETWEKELSLTQNSQPAICLASVLWDRFLNNMGLSPAAVGGHSLGELTAFYRAGVFDADELFKMACLRGRAMGSSGEKNGGMVSLRCSLSEAEKIVSVVGGRLVVANINGPRQIVLSGESAAIEKTLQFAATKGTKALRLPVSQAFHSELCAGAARIIEGAGILNKQAEGMQTKLFSSFTGGEVSRGIRLSSHFSKQITAKVDFVSMVRAMAKQCDIFLEIGPGRVLSGLVNDMFGNRGPFCYPIESSAFQDEDLNRAMAALFVNGVDLRWRRLFDQRLTREFSPVSEKIFVENQCESILDVDGVSSVSEKLSGMEAIKSYLPDLFELQESQILDYLRYRAPFLSSLIHADLKYTFGKNFPPSAVSPDDSILREEGEAEEQLSVRLIEKEVFSQVHKITGFSVESLDPEMRLLDDLNLDSIKAGDLIVRVGKKLNMATPADPLDFANASLSDVIQAYESGAKIVGPDEFGDTGASVREVVAEQASRLTGYPVETLDLDALIEMDLGIGPDRLRNLIQSCTNILKIDSHLDLEPLRERSLSQIASILERLLKNQARTEAPDSGKGAAGSKFKGLQSWVRDFKVEFKEVPAEPLPDWWGKRKEDDWRQASALIICEPENNDVGQALRRRLLAEGAQAQTAFYREAQERHLTEDPSYSLLIAVLPDIPGSLKSPESFVREIVERLSAIASPPPASSAPRRRTSVAYIQFGGGFFGTRPPFYHPNQCCAAALAKSVHLERDDLRVRVLDFSWGIDPDAMSEIALSEINTPASFAAVGFDFEMKRRVAKPLLAEPHRYIPRSIKWSSKDVVVVTGGARGITASIAFGVALATGVRMALVGASDYPGKSTGGEIADTLEKYSENGLFAEYFTCDVTDEKSVRQTAVLITEKMGPITGVIHGAGLNKPRPIHLAPVSEAIEEVSPKVVGALNLMHALEKSPLKIFVGLSSIIGFTGMPGNGWYGLSNEVLEILIRRFAANRPEIATLSVAFSIWRDVGMGHKMGSVGILEKMGVDSISPKEGVNRFLRLFLNDPGVDRVIITARMAEIDAFKPEIPPRPKNMRFLEKPIYTMPGVESVYSAHLSLESDIYLLDHVFNGSYLFPTVFGLEAMAQAAASTVGKTVLERVRIEKIRLERPITVDPENGADILIQAVAYELDENRGARKIRTSIYKPGAGVEDEFFSAEFIFDVSEDPVRKWISIDQNALDIIPEFDIYRENLLFQGPKFQQIDKIYTIEPNENENSREAVKAVLGVVANGSGKAAEKAFANFNSDSLILGDPFYRDSLLQSALLMVPAFRSLPVFIERIDIFPHPEAVDETLSCEVTLDQRKDESTVHSVTVADKNGFVREIFKGYKLHILRRLEDNPSPKEIMNPGDRDNSLFTKKINSFAQVFGMAAPSAQVAYLPGLHQLSKEKRHQWETSLIRQTVAIQNDGANEEKTVVKWLANGKPIISGTGHASVDISLSHDDRLCFCVAGKGPQGCDVAPIHSFGREKWIKLVGKKRKSLFEELTERCDSPDRAGSRLWAVMETVKKAAGENASLIAIEKLKGGAALFSAEVSKGKISILTFPLELTWGPNRIFSLTVEKAQAVTSSGRDYSSAFEDLSSVKAFETVENSAPQGQGYFVHRFPVTFKPNAQMSRKVYFSNYFFWLGEVREIGVWPVLDKVAENFATGLWGLVTNKTHMKILGEASARDHIEIRLWINRGGGRQNPIMDLTFDYRKMLPEGGYERLAWCEQQVTWVRILDHGVVESQPYPDYYWNFLKTMLPRYDAPNVSEPIPEPLSFLENCEGDEEYYQAPPKPMVEPVLMESNIRTSLDNSNIVGNIYFANYYAWQGQVRDRFFYETVPEYFRGAGENGELLCLQTEVHHLREAMPFDDVVVTMALKAWTRYSAVFHFEYFRSEPGGERVKLAYGEHRSIWVVRKEDGRPIPTEFPEPVVERFRRAISRLQ